MTTSPAPAHLFVAVADAGINAALDLRDRVADDPEAGDLVARIIEQLLAVRRLAELRPARLGDLTFGD